MKTIVMTLGLLFSALTWATPTELNILFVGNSLTGYNFMPAVFQKMAQSRGHKPHVEAFVRFGGKLSEHLQKADLRKVLTDRKWDVLILQEYSNLPLVEPEAFKNSVLTFAGLTRSSGTKLILFQNWSYKGENRVEGLDAIYKKVADLTSARVARFASGFELIQQASSVDLYTDEKHTTPIVSYLGALTFMNLIYNERPETLPRLSSEKNSEWRGVLPETWPFLDLDRYPRYGPGTVDLIQEISTKIVSPL